MAEFEGIFISSRAHAATSESWPSSSGWWHWHLENRGQFLGGGSWRDAGRAATGSVRVRWLVATPREERSEDPIARAASRVSFVLLRWVVRKEGSWGVFFFLEGDLARRRRYLVAEGGGRRKRWGFYLVSVLSRCLLDGNGGSVAAGAIKPKIQWTNGRLCLHVCVCALASSMWASGRAAAEPHRQLQLQLRLLPLSVLSSLAAAFGSDLRRRTPLPSLLGCGYFAVSLIFSGGLQLAQGGRELVAAAKMSGAALVAIAASIGNLLQGWDNATIAKDFFLSW
ncbi:hypothetical protein GUJ93_ZPchr0597g2916 [Zizania palustris]|uniref:Uncharacterized protein n=1 Tax=Zizania palustris TaxID=103762 RepID=A0A8J5R1D8_ZIZPA|nr:hypothetical protein GUJ93_ZPchr0597g2916 [Zizania palustris]